MKTIFLLLLSYVVHAETLTSVSKPYAFTEAPEYKAILALLKSHGDFDAPPAPKELSRGERMVEEAKARNRAKLAELRKEEERKPKLEGPEAWKEEVKSTHAAWKKEIEDTRRQWQREQDIFLGRIKVYQDATFELPVKKEVIKEKNVEADALPDAAVVNGAFAVPVRDQYGRATCAAFSGIRALEILLVQNALPRDLSEQYFYWSSKPNCYQAPCREKGSWVTSGFKLSQSKPTPDIPLERNCAYDATVNLANETQLPLVAGCLEAGEVKVASFEEVRTLADAIDQLKRNVPVVMGAKLTPNFYKNQGLVTLGDSSTPIAGLSLDFHALGHAFLGVGLIELPKALRAAEGLYCIIVANSWGTGWGAGGYSCLTQKWLEKFRQKAPFMAVTKVSTK